MNLVAAARPGCAQPTPWSAPSPDHPAAGLVERRCSRRATASIRSIYIEDSSGNELDRPDRSPLHRAGHQRPCFRRERDTTARASRLTPPARRPTNHPDGPSRQLGGPRVNESRHPVWVWPEESAPRPRPPTVPARFRPGAVAADASARRSQPTGIRSPAPTTTARSRSARRLGVDYRAHGTNGEAYAGSALVAARIRPRSADRRGGCRASQAEPTNGSQLDRSRRASRGARRRAAC
jgi:hypothetical protein